MLNVNDFSKLRFREVILPSLANVTLRGSALVSRFALVVIIAKALSPEDLGLFGLFMSLIAFNVLLIGGDFYTHSNRELLASKRQRWSFYVQQHMFALLLFYLLLLPVQGLLFVNAILPTKYALYYVLILVLEHLTQELNRFLVIAGKPIHASLVMIVRMGVWVWLLLPLLWFNPDYQSLDVVFSFWIIGLLLAMLIGCALAKKELKNWQWYSLDINWIKSGLKVAIIFLISSLCLKGISTLDRVFFASLNDNELLGVYVLFSGIAMAITNVLDPAVFSFMYPRLVALYQANDFVAYDRQFKAMLFGVVGVTALLFCAVITIAPIVTVWLGDDAYTSNLRILWYLVAAVALYNLSMVFHYGLYAMGKDRAILLSHVCAAALFVILVYGFRDSSPVGSILAAVVAANAWLLFSKLAFYFYLKAGNAISSKISPINVLNSGG